MPDAAAVPDCAALLDVELENRSALAPDAGPVCSAVPGRSFPEGAGCETAEPAAEGAPAASCGASVLTGGVSGTGVGHACASACCSADLRIRLLVGVVRSALGGNPEV